MFHSTLSYPKNMTKLFVQLPNQLITRAHSHFIRYTMLTIEKIPQLLKISLGVC
jgi:hypothetical protein